MIITNFTLVTLGAVFGVSSVAALVLGYFIVPANDYLPLPAWNVIGGLLFAIGVIIGLNGLRRA